VEYFAGIHPWNARCDSYCFCILGLWIQLCRSISAACSLGPCFAVLRNDALPTIWYLPAAFLRFQSSMNCRLIALWIWCHLAHLLLDIPCVNLQVISVSDGSTIRILRRVTYFDSPSGVAPAPLSAFDRVCAVDLDLATLTSMSRPNCSPKRPRLCNCQDDKQLCCSTAHSHSHEFPFM